MYQAVIIHDLKNRYQVLCVQKTKTSSVLLCLWVLISKLYSPIYGIKYIPPLSSQTLISYSYLQSKNLYLTESVRNSNRENENGAAFTSGEISFIRNLGFGFS